MYIYIYYQYITKITQQVDVAEAMTYRGKHALLISQTGDADTVHVRKGLSAMRAQSVIYRFSFISAPNIFKSLRC